MDFPRHELFLRIWIAVVAFMALGNTFAIFFGTPTFLKSKLYNSKPDEPSTKASFAGGGGSSASTNFGVTPLASRLFGCWTLLASIVRAYCSVYIRNKALYHVTLLTFVIAFLHFFTELLAFKTCLLEVGVISPLIISGISFLWMFVAQWFIEFDDPAALLRMKSRNKKRTD